MAKMVSLNTKTVNQENLQKSIELIDEKKDEQTLEENKVETISLVVFAITIMGILIFLLS